MILQILRDINNNVLIIFPCYAEIIRFVGVFLN